MTIGIILALIDLGFCVFIMYYCCKYKKRLDRLEYLHTMDSEDANRFRADTNKRLEQHDFEINSTARAAVYDPDGNLQEITIDELAEYILNNEPLVRKADKVIWGKDENKSNI